MAITFEALQSLARPDALQEAERKKQSAADIGDRFLKLLVTQMRNQDPLNPLQNAEVTSQLAQISTVTGVDKLNATMEALSQVIASAQTMQATSLVGRSVLAPGRELEVGDKGAVAGMNLKEAAALVTVEILDKANKVVRSFELKNHPAGLSTFEWDGLDDKGAVARGGAPYSFRLTPLSNGRKTEYEPYALAQVSSVSLGGSEMIVNTRSHGALAMSQIKQIY